MGKSVYRSVLDSDSGKTVLEAISEASASLYYRKIEIDLEEQPWVHWSWKVDAPVITDPQFDERAKTGDDYAARVYVGAKTGPFPWQYKAITYVWSSAEPVGSQWPNPFASDVEMLVLRSADDRGQWYSEKRNVINDFNRLFGTDIRSIEGVSIMSDSDNSVGHSQSWFGPIVFSSE